MDIRITAFSEYIAYVDPILAIVLMLLFVTIPLSEIKKCLKELKQATPSEEIRMAVKQKIDDIDYDYDFKDKVLRIGKSSDKVRIEIDYVITKESALNSIDQQDQLRRELAKKLSELPYGKWVNINFTNDLTWTNNILV